MSNVPLYEYHPKSTSFPLALPDGKVRTIEINPGMAFGTGNHATTRLCIKLLEDLFKDTKLDNDLYVGCGILAICSVTLGAKKAFGLDIDFSVVAEARKNIDLNGLSSSIQVERVDIQSINGEFEPIMANILIDLINSIAAEIAAKLKSDGLLLISGFHDDKKETVIQKFFDLGLLLEDKLSEDGWSA